MWVNTLEQLAARIDAASPEIGNEVEAAIANDTNKPDLEVKKSSGLLSKLFGK